MAKAVSDGAAVSPRHLEDAASVARELGIPAVFGVRNARARIVEGEVVTVDGTSGRVWLSPPEHDDVSGW